MLSIPPKSIAASLCVPARSSQPYKPCAPANGRWILVASIIGSAMAFMDGSVVNVALPTLQSAFHASATGIQWVIQSYALLAASLLLLGGAIGDRYGRRRAFLWGVGLFAASSAVCAASQSLAQLLAESSVKGIGAAEPRQNAATIPSSGLYIRCYG